MNNQRLLSTAACACVLAVVTSTSRAAAISGQGTWETTLQPRDLDGNTSTIEAYYDTVLNITWLANATYACLHHSQIAMTFTQQINQYLLNRVIFCTIDELPNF